MTSSTTVGVDPLASIVGEPPHISYFADPFSAADVSNTMGTGGPMFHDFLSSIHAHERSEHENIIPNISGFQDISWPVIFNTDSSRNTPISRESMIYCVAQYRSWPARWVTESKAPFIHPALYAGTSPEFREPSFLTTNHVSGLPPVLQDAFAVCAAYAAKNELNSPLVMSLIETKSTALLYSPDQAQWTAFEQLAALQALIILQMMRVFDGDIRQRALGEASEPILASWTTNLQTLVGRSVFDGSDIHMDTFGERPASLSGSDYSGSLDANLGVPERIPSRRSTPTGQSTARTHDGIESSWKQWLFNETIRRTLITSYMVRGIYAMARQGHSHLGSVVTDMSFTSCSRLWAATTPGRWKRARETTDPGWISHMDFDQMLSSADPRNVDEFAVMMAVTYRGKDAVEDWMARGLQSRRRSVSHE